jgi:Arc/MetJ-type ribon-helix-helix transcriptional regulator
MLTKSQQEFIKEDIRLLEEHLDRIKKRHTQDEVAIPELEQRIETAEKRLKEGKV